MHVNQPKKNDGNSTAAVVESLVNEQLASASAPSVSVGHAFYAGLASRRRIVNPNKKAYNRKRNNRKDW